MPHAHEHEHEHSEPEAPKTKTQKTFGIGAIILSVGATLFVVWLVGYCWAYEMNHFEQQVVYVRAPDDIRGEQVKQGAKNNYLRQTAGVEEQAEQDPAAAIDRYNTETVVLKTNLNNVGNPPSRCQGSLTRTEADGTQVRFIPPACRVGMDVVVYQGPARTANVRMGPGMSHDDMVGKVPPLEGFPGAGTATATSGYGYNLQGFVLLKVPVQYAGGLYVRLEP